MQTPRAIAIAIVTVAIGGAGQCRADEALGRALSAVAWTPQAFAASGLSGADVTAVLQVMAGSEEFGLLCHAQLQLSAAEFAQEQCVRTANPLTGEGAAQLAAAADGVRAARSILRARSDACAEAALANCAAGPADRLRRWRNALPELPAEFRVAPFDAALGRRLQRALRDEVIAAASGGAIPPLSAALLSEARANPDVVAATGALSLRLTEITGIVSQATH